MPQYPVVTSGLGEQGGMVPVADGTGNFTWQSISSVVQGITSPAGVQPEDLLVYSGSSWARLPVGGTDQYMVVRPDGTVNYETPHAISARAWNVRPTNSSATNSTNLQAAITQASQNSGRGPGGTAAAGRIDVAPGTYTFNAATLMKFGAKLYGVGGMANTVFKADSTVPLSNYQNGSRTDANGNKVPALIRWDGGDQWAHGVHVVGISFDTSGIPGLSGMWFESTGENSWFDDLDCSSCAAVTRTINDAQLVAGSNVVTVGAPPVLVAATTATPGSGGGTTPGINTTGATLLLVAIGTSSGTVTVTDSLNNQWNVIGSSGARLAYAWQGPSSGALATGTGHTVTVTGTSSFPAIRFMAYSGTLTTANPLDGSNAPTNSGLTIQAGPVTTTKNSDLLVSVLGTANGTGGVEPTIDSGFTIPYWIDEAGGINYSLAVATNIALLPGVVNPTWGVNIGTGNAAVLAAFKAIPSPNSFTDDDVNAIITTGGAVAAPAAPAATAGGSGGTITPRTYEVGVTYLTANGETHVSTTTAVLVATGQQLTIPSPSPATGATGWFAYVDNGNGDRLTRQQAAGAPTAIGTNLVLSAQPTTTGATPYKKIDRIGWAANSTAVSTGSIVLSQPAAATLTNVSLTVARPTDAFTFQGGVPGRIGQLHGVTNSGALLRLKYYGGTMVIDQLSGDDNVGGMLRISSAAQLADPAFVTVNNIKAESDGYNTNWQYSHDATILLDRCWTVGLNVLGGTFSAGVYARDLVRLDNSLSDVDVGGPSIHLSGVEGQNWYNTAFANIIHDTQTGEAIPVSAYGEQHPYPDILWGRRELFGGGGSVRLFGLAGTLALLTRLVATDANPAFQVTTDGKLQWGPGGGTALDTNLYRKSAATLKTDTSLVSGTVISANDGAASQVVLGWDNQAGFAGPCIEFSSTQDTAIRRTSAGIIQLTNQLQLKLATPTYGPTVTPDAGLGSWATITVTNATALAIAAPINPPDASHTTVLYTEVFNNTAAAMGTITWNAIFLWAGFTWANPAAGKKRWARWEWNGTNWICTGVALADY